MVQLRLTTAQFPTCASCDHKTSVQGCSLIPLEVLPCPPHRFGCAQHTDFSAAQDDEEAPADAAEWRTLELASKWKYDDEQGTVIEIESLPEDDNGYIEAFRVPEERWQLSLDFFSEHFTPVSNPADESPSNTSKIPPPYVPKLFDYVRVIEINEKWSTRLRVGDIVQAGLGTQPGLSDREGWLALWTDDNNRAICRVERVFGPALERSEPRALTHGEVVSKLTKERDEALAALKDAQEELQQSYVTQTDLEKAWDVASAQTAELRAEWRKQKKRLVDSNEELRSQLLCRNEPHEDLAEQLRQIEAALKDIDWPNEGENVVQAVRSLCSAKMELARGLAVSRKELGRTPVAPYIPKPGDNVRIVEMLERLLSPQYEVGQGVLVSRVSTFASFPGWIMLNDATICRVEPIAQSGADERFSHQELQGFYGKKVDDPHYEATLKGSQVGDLLREHDLALKTIDDLLVELCDSEDCPVHGANECEVATQCNTRLRARVAELSTREAANKATILNLDKCLLNLKEVNDAHCEANARYVEVIETALSQAITAESRLKHEQEQRQLLSTDLNALIDGKPVVLQLAHVVQQKHQQELAKVELQANEKVSALEAQLESLRNCLRSTEDSAHREVVRLNEVVMKLEQLQKGRGVADTATDVIRASADVVLEPGEYEVVELASRQRYSSPDIIAVGARFKIDEAQKPWKSNDRGFFCCWVVEGTRVTAVRRIESVAKEATGPNDMIVIRAAEGVVLEPGEYEVVELAVQDYRPNHKPGDTFRVHQGERAHGLPKYWRAGPPYCFSLVAAVRRVVEPAKALPSNCVSCGCYADHEPDSAACQPAKSAEPLYIPKPGDTVRVVELAPYENNPRHAVGAVVTVHADTASNLRDGWLLLFTPECADGTWCRVALVTERVWVCSSCKDSHLITLHRDGQEDRVVPCTSCPMPCDFCAFQIAGQSRDSYCAKTPCSCSCHVVLPGPGRSRLPSAPVEPETTRGQLQCGLDGVASVLGRPALLVGEHAKAVAEVMAERDTALASVEALRAERDQLSRLYDSRGTYLDEANAKLSARDAELSKLTDRCDSYKADAAYWKAQRDATDVENDKQRAELTACRAELEAEQRACTQLHCDVSNAWVRFRDSNESTANNELWDTLQKISGSNPHAKPAPEPRCAKRNPSDTRLLCPLPADHHGGCAYYCLCKSGSDRVQPGEAHAARCPMSAIQRRSQVYDGGGTRSGSPMDVSQPAHEPAGAEQPSMFTSLTPEQLATVEPLSEAAIREALRLGSAEVEAIRTGRPISVSVGTAHQQPAGIPPHLVITNDIQWVRSQNLVEQPNGGRSIIVGSTWQDSEVPYAQLLVEVLETNDATTYVKLTEPGSTRRALGTEAFLARFIHVCDPPPSGEEEKAECTCDPEDTGPMMHFSDCPRQIQLDRMRSEAEPHLPQAQKSIEELIAASSLGAPEVVALRAKADPVAVACEQSPYAPAAKGELEKGEAT
jgi:hypothetical protein